ncbi:MAG TPA: AI-2E family transporter [Steroidobacteraceae bacterium]|nr:AI-2E family transporter [Steroidobacteraceae bacterium]
MPPENATTAQKTARYVLIGALVLAGAWMLRHFIPALCWAVVLAIATSSLYDRWLDRFRGGRRDVWAALTFTILVGAVLVVPLVYGGVVAGREAIALARDVAASAGSGPPPLPPWLAQIPWLGRWIREFWAQYLGPAGAGAGARVHASPVVIEWTRIVGMQVARRIVTLAFTLLTLFFVYLNRDRLLIQVPRMFRRLFGSSVDRLLRRVVSAIRAAVDGIVLVAVGEGAIMAGVYTLAHAPHPILSGVITGVFATVPFAAPIVFGIVAVVLVARGSIAAAIAVGAAGTLVLFIADHFVRPVIIGEGAKLPFLWALLGILGGVESFGLVGIFIGPALMAALVSLWRGWVEEMPADGP